MVREHSGTTADSRSAGTAWAGRRSRFATLSLAALLGGALLLGAGRPAHADDFDKKSDSFTKNRVKKNSDKFLNLVVQLDGSFDGTKQAGLDAFKNKSYNYLPIINAVAIQVPTGQAKNLAKLPFVKRISEDATVYKKDEFTVSSSLASTAWSNSGVSGSGITVAVVDSGITPHGDLANRILANVSFVDGDSSTLDACGHGTHVAGIVAGSGASSTGTGFTHTFYGVAPSANLVNVRVLGSNGSGTVSGVISGIQWCINNKSLYNIRVLNLSFGHAPAEGSATDPLCQACEQAWKAGIFVAVAAGNGGRLNSSPQPGVTDNEGYGTAYGSIDSPGTDPYVITVGAMKNIDGNRAHDAIATYSGRGPTLGESYVKPDVVAPGNQVISLYAPSAYLETNYSGNTVSPSFYNPSAGVNDAPQYFTLSGTSMATPVVAGAAALMIQNNPNLTPDTIKARMMMSADHWAFPNGTSDPCTFGSGYLNIPAAISSPYTSMGYSLSPMMMGAPGAGGPGTVNAGDNVIWGSTGLWGTGVTSTNVLWGDNVISGTTSVILDNVIWGSDIIFGDSGSLTIGGSPIVGDNVIWGSATEAASTSILSVFGEKR